MLTQEREFKTKGGCFAIGFAGCFPAVFGLVALVFFWPLGVLLLLLAVALPFVVNHFLTNTRIVVGPHGFSVSSQSNAAGARQQEYRWDEVTATNYDEDVHRSSQGGSRTTRHFTVETSRGRAFRVGSGIGDFDALIGVFNQMATQVPYTWERQTGFAVSIGPVSNHREMYHRMPRSQPPGQLPPEPPPPPQAPPPPPSGEPPSFILR